LYGKSHNTELRGSGLSKAEKNFNTEIKQKQETFFVETQVGKNHGEEREFTIVKKLQ